MQRRGQIHYPEKLNRKPNRACALCEGIKGDIAVWGNGFSRNRVSHSTRILSEGALSVFMAALSQFLTFYHLMEIPLCTRGPDAARGPSVICRQSKTNRSLHVCVCVLVCVYDCMCASVRKNVRPCALARGGWGREREREEWGSGYQTESLITLCPR